MKRLMEIFDGAYAAVLANRRASVIVAACVLFFVGSVFFLAKGEAALAKKRAALASFEKMRAEYAVALSAAGPLREKFEAKDAALSAMDAVQSAAASAGISKAIAQLKPFEPAAMKGWKQSGAELKLEGVDIGRAVYFLYSLESSPAAVVVDEFRMKSSFENPDALSVTASVRSIARE